MKPSLTLIPSNEDEVDEDGVPLYYIRILNLLDIADEYLCGSTQGHLKELCEVVLTKMVISPSIYASPS